MMTMTALRNDSPVDLSILEAWCDSTLPDEEADALCLLVRQPGSWQQAYRERIAELAQRVGVRRLDVSRSASVANDESEIEFARRVEYLVLPHLGKGVRREAHLHRDGIWWRLSGASELWAELVPYGTSSFIWDVDPVLGRLTTEIVELPSDRLDDAEEAARSLHRLADGLPHPRARAIALAVANDLCSGDLFQGVRAAAAAFNTAQLDLSVHQKWVECALLSQIALDSFGYRVHDGELDRLLDEAEKSLSPYASGLLVLEDDHYHNLVEGCVVDPQAWWGLQERLDIKVPSSVIDGLLAAL